MLYRFVGTFAELPDQGIRLEHYGQQVEMEESVAQSAILNRCALIPEEQFAAVEHTPEELEQFHHTTLHPDAPPEFLAKRDQAWSLLRDHRAGLEAAQEKE